MALFAPNFMRCLPFALRLKRNTATRFRMYSSSTTTPKGSATASGAKSPSTSTPAPASGSAPGVTSANLAEVINKWLYSQIAGWSGVPNQKLSKEFSSTWIKAHVYIAESYSNRAVQQWMLALTCLVHGTVSSTEASALNIMFRKEAPTSINRKELMANLPRLSADSFSKKVNFPTCLLYSCITAMVSQGVYNKKCVDRVKEVATAMNISAVYLKQVEGVAKADCNVRSLRINLLHPTGPPF